MAVSNQEIVDYLAANRGMNDYQIAQQMDKFGVTPAQMAEATGLAAKDVQSRYDNAQAIGSYFANNQGVADTEYAKAMNKNGWDANEVSLATGTGVNEVNARLNTANQLNTLTDQYGNLQKTNADLSANYGNLQKSNADLNANLTNLQKSNADLSTNFGTLQTQYADLQKNNAAGLATLQSGNQALSTQLAELQKQFSELNAARAAANAAPAAMTTANTAPTGVGNTEARTSQSGSTGATTGTSGIVDLTSSEKASTVGSATTQGVVYGPDGSMYSSPAAAVAAGVSNWSRTKPAFMLNANTDAGLINNANDTTKVIGLPKGNGGGLISQAMGSSNPVTNNPFAIGGPYNTQNARVGLPKGVLGLGS